MRNGTKSHIINSQLISFVQCVRESVCRRFFPHRRRRSVCTKTSGKYFPVQTSHSVNKSSIYVYVQLVRQFSVHCSGIFSIHSVFWGASKAGQKVKYQAVLYTKLSDNLVIIQFHQNFGFFFPMIAQWRAVI